MKYTFLTLFMILIQLSLAQTTVLRIGVIDEKDQESVQNVSITCKQNGKASYYSTNRKGQSQFEVKSDQECILFLSHAQLESVERKLSSSQLRTDTLDLRISMKYTKIQDLEDVVVTAPGTPRVVYQSDRLHVEDFEVLPKGDIVLLTYPKRLKKGSELVLFDGLKVIQSFQVPDIAQELTRDYLGNVHVLCEENVFGVHPEGHEIGISSLSRDYFLKYLAPIIDTNRSKMYFSNFNPDYPAFDYFAYDQADSVYSKLLSIEDELMMELYRSEYKWVDVRTKLWARTKEMETGVDAEIWVGANYFTQSPYYKELYAPLFHRNDSLFVFDYYRDLLFHMDNNGSKQDSIPIYHHYRKKQTGWRSELIQDRLTGVIYALYDRHGYTYIGRVDTRTGNIEGQVKLNYRFVSKVQIFNNEVYYVYRPYESPQKKYLYKERLPYDFAPAKVDHSNSNFSEIED